MLTAVSLNLHYQSIGFECSLPHDLVGNWSQHKGVLIGNLVVIWISNETGSFLELGKPVDTGS